LAAKQHDGATPAALQGNREATVIYNNLPQILPQGRADDEEELVGLALRIDRAMHEWAPAGWKGDQAREAQVQNALFPLLGRDRDATRALFELIKNQPGY
jgi:type I restriction enzyme R subunit